VDRKIEYGEHPTYFLGLDGRFASSGLQIADRDNTTLLTPLTSKGEAGKSFIEIPNEEARAIAYALLSIARKHQSQEAKEKGVTPKSYDDNPYEHHSSYDGCCEDCPACDWERENRCEEYEEG